MKNSQLAERIENKKQRLKAYYDRELLMLSPEGVQSYGVGSRNLTRYNTDLSEVRRAIKELEKEIQMLENSLRGKGSMKVFGIVPRDI